MKLTIITNEEGPETRDAMEAGKNLEDEGYNVEYLVWDEEDSESKAAIYDIYRTPAFLVTQDDGTYVELWQGEIPSAANIKHQLIHD